MFQCEGDGLFDGEKPAAAEGIFIPLGVDLGADVGHDLVMRRPNPRGDGG